MDLEPHPRVRIAIPSGQSVFAGFIARSPQSHCGDDDAGWSKDAQWKSRPRAAAMVTFELHPTDVLPIHGGKRLAASAPHLERAHEGVEVGEVQEAIAIEVAL